MPTVNLTALLAKHITDARAILAAEDTFTASLTVARTRPLVFRATVDAVREASALARTEQECNRGYGGDLIDLDTLRASEDACVDLDAHEALSDDADIYDAIVAEQREAFERDAALSTRDDGAIYHGRLPGDDCDGFSPHIVAQRGPRVLFRLPTLPGGWEVA